MAGDMGVFKRRVGEYILGQYGIYLHLDQAYSYQKTVIKNEIKYGSSGYIYDGVKYGDDGSEIGPKA